MNVDLEKYKHIIESLHEGIIIHDKDFNILYINKFMSDILGYSAKELNSLNILDILDETNQNIIKINSIDIEENKSYDLKIITKNKSFKYIRLTSSLYIDNDVEYKLCICEDITSIHREETVKSCIYKISEAIHDVDDLQSLYKEIHYILSEVTNTNNFYIALVDWENEILTFPYFVDEYDEPPKPRKLENGLTEYVLRSEESILLNHELYLKLVKNKSIDVRGSDSKNWLGVPLKLTNGKTIGMIGIQSYKKDIFFTEEDLKILLFVSDQIAMAIKRKIDDIKIHKQAHYDQLTG